MRIRVPKVVMENEVVAGIDIGGTKIAIMLQDRDEKTLASFRLPTRANIKPSVVVANALDEIEMNLVKIGSKIVAVGIGCPNPLDIEKGLVLSPTNLPTWVDFPLVKMVEDRFGVPTILDNDANVAALGECYFGAGKDFENMLYITVSTGIGGAIICDGKILHGVAASAGEIGHTVVKYDGRFCLCGTRGCLETIASGKSIVRSVRERLAEGGKSKISGVAADPSKITTKMVAAAVENGDELARSVWDDACRFLGIGIGNAITTFAPNAVIIGGGVAQAGDVLFKPLTFYINQNVNMLPIEDVSILRASLGGDSGVFGAAKMAQLLLEPKNVATQAT